MKKAKKLKINYLIIIKDIIKGNIFIKNYINNYVSNNK